MATIIDNAYQKLADLQLWYKVQSSDELLLSDIPSLIPLRWTYFKNNWEFFKPELEDRITAYYAPNLLRDSIDKLNSFIKIQRISPVPNPFNRPNILKRYYAVFDNMPISKLGITFEEQAKINKEMTRVSLFTKTDFINIRTAITKARDLMADNVGGSDITYDGIYKRVASSAQSDITINDISLMLQLQNALLSLEYILANIYSVATASIDPFLLAKTNANNSKFNMAQYKSGTLVTLNVGETLQALAKRTLGDPDKWIDIAIANGLKPPYIDEYGSVISLLTNGNGNQINIAKLDSLGYENISKFYVNQAIYLSSDVEPVIEQHIITNITEIKGSNDIILELDGDKTLSKYKSADNAILRVYKINTINSNYRILIPSTSPLSDTAYQSVPYFLQTSGEDERRAKVDILLTDTKDICFTSFNDIQLAYSLENAAQAVMLKLEVEQGELRAHPEFGLVSVVGKTNRDPANIRATLSKSIASQIDNDPRFERLEKLVVQYVSEESAMYVSLEVRLAGSQVSIPITFSVNM